MSSIAGGPRLSVNSAAPTATTQLVGQFWLIPTESLNFSSDRSYSPKSHLSATRRNRYLFETRRFGPFTTRRIQQIVQGYREKARYVAADSPAPVPPSDADLLDIQGPLRRTDPTDFRPRKQKKPGGLPASVVGIGR
jgi:hypothetical protein